MPTEGSRRLRVLFVIPDSEEGSGSIFSKRQADALERANIDLIRFYLRPWVSLPVFAAEALRYRREVGRLRPDIVHAQYGTMTSALCAALPGRKLVVTFRGSDLNPDSGVGFIRLHFGHLLSQLSALRASRTVCVSQELKDRLWWRRNAAEVIPSAVDADVFRPQPKDEARRALGWDMFEKVALLNVGNDPANKGLKTAEAAVKVASAAIGPIRLLVLSGEVAPEQMPLYINASDCVLVASDWEGSPTIVQEAMACNVPVVSTNVGDVAERLEPVVPSRVTDRSPANLGAALAEVLSLGLRSNGSEHLREVSLGATTQRLIDLYARVASGGNESRPAAEAEG